MPLGKDARFGFDRFLFLLFVRGNGFAELNVGAVGAFPQAHVEPCFRVFTEVDRAGGERQIAVVVTVPGDGELARVFALRVVRASDECAVATEL